MSSEVFISVVVATWGREQYLLECLASVLAQSYRAYEVVIVDQDRTRNLPDAIQRRFGNDVRIRYLNIDQAGLSRARNAGVQHAKGVVVAFIDDDAIAEPSWLEGIAEAFSRESNLGLLAGRIDPIWPRKRPEWYPREREFLLGLYDIGEEMCPMPEHDLPVGSNMAGLRKVIMHCGGFDERFGFNHFRKRPLIAGEDSLLGERVKKAGYALFYQPKAAVRHRIGAHKLTRKYFLRRHFWEGVTTIERMAILGQISPDTREHFAYHIRAIGMALARAVLPAFENRYPLPHPVIRMLALSRAAFNWGVLYGLVGLRKQIAEGRTRCASA
jgi:glucosyl-dolichyl phosphate glucuronosyltransferase